MTARLFTDVPTSTELDQRERDHEVDRTPRGLVRAALAELVTGQHWPATGDGSHAFGHEERWSVGVAGTRIANVNRVHPLRILDVCAGAGVWSSEARRLFTALGVPVEITAVEIRPEERERLRKWADHVIIGNVHHELQFVGETFDLAIGKPHFTGLHAMLPDLLGPVANATILLHTTQAFQRSVEGLRLVHEHPPVIELRVGQSVQFRPKAGADLRCYSVSAWVGRREPGSAWMTKGLPLGKAARKWAEIPGAEERLGEDLPTAPGWKP